MPHVVTDNCHLCRFTDCVAVCPVECFHSDEERTYIDPDVCIDCGACIPACPVHAIYETIDMPDDQRRWVAINADRSHALPVVYAKQDPLPTAAARRAELGYRVRRDSNHRGNLPFCCEAARYARGVPVSACAYSPWRP